MVSPPAGACGMVGRSVGVRLGNAYSGEVDRPFRRNVTGDSAKSALQLISTRIGHVQSRLLDETRSAASAAEAPERGLTGA
jgi:hypothetical protein